MKLSICIPVYNQEVRALVDALQKEIQSDALDAEIILIDDASQEKYKNLNASLSVNHNIHLPKNIGRAAIRNLFLEYAKGDFLLFLDCDAIIDDQDFIKNYLAFIENNPNAQVVFGGFVIHSTVPLFLREKYSLYREIVPLQKRIKNPTASFRGINFCVRTSILERFGFDESLKTYGYEDMIFAKTLEGEGIKIEHIDNPVLHDSVEAPMDFLVKTSLSIENLKVLHQKNPKLVKELPLVKLAKLITKLRWSFLFQKLFLIFEPTIVKGLSRKNPSLILFDLYKLGLFLTNNNKSK